MQLSWLKKQSKNDPWSNVDEAAFRAAFETATSFIDVLRLLGIPYTGRRRAQVPQIARQLKLDPARFDGHRQSGAGKNWLGADHHLRQKGARGKLGALRKSLQEKGRHLSCETCGQGPTWSGKALVLQLDHKNGDRFDDREENLRFLCPNCHSQTDTFAGRNRKRLMLP